VNEASRDDRDSRVSHDLRNPIRESDGFGADEGGRNAVQTSESWLGPRQTAGGCRACMLHLRACTRVHTRGALALEERVRRVMAVVR
jgi:hypothetical protein